MNEIPYLKAMIYLIITIFVLTILYLLMKVSPIFGQILFFIKNLFLPFFIALIISYLLHPIVTILHNRGVPRSIAVLLIYIVFFGSVTIICLRAFPLLATQVKELGENLPLIIQRIKSWLDGIRNGYPIPDSIQKGIDTSIQNWEAKLTSGFSHVMDWVGNTISILFTIFLVPFVSFYILKDYKLIEKTVITFVPRSKRKGMIRLLKEIDEALGNYIRGQLIVITIVGVLAYIGYLIIDLPYALLLAFIVSITDIIPYIGPFIGMAPALIVAMSISWKMVISVLIVNLTIQALEGNVISPQVVGRKLNIHPLLIIISLLIGGESGGVVGMILAVPIFAILKVILQHIFIYLRKTRI
ncbi:putative PurR-regulated permease PerM [Tepidibacillus fermentans]|uniref:Putative PurR-regulated permease PerM n=2 Tax=Tepidibacillus fermentans TaxID=1281767 RepID=A0A4R3KJE5_9BACI|nr:putative PurR-regulated permease PerM [Tepidibacillus fermentans]